MERPRARGLTLDSGALIGYERKDPASLARIELALDDGAPVTVPAACLAEAWRGGPRSARLARLRSHVAIAPLDESVAMRAGELLGMAGTHDAVDAAVVAGAAQRGDAVLTSDPDDIRRLAAHANDLAVLVV